MSKEKTSIAKAKHARNEVWEGIVLPALRGAVAVAWDECHKIYVLKDEEQLRVMRKLGYPQIVKRTTGLPAEDADDILLKTIKAWFSWSCAQRFVQAVTTVTNGNPNDGYESLIEQAHPAFGIPLVRSVQPRA